MTGTFIDTIVICTLTGLSVVITGAWQVEGLEGVQVTTYAFQNGLPFSNQFCAAVLMICLVFFAFTTILGWDYYGERCLEYLTGKDEKKIKIYRWLYILAVFIGPYMTVAAVWTIADIFNGLMALPNMIALFALSGVVVKETKRFFEVYADQKMAKKKSSASLRWLCSFFSFFLSLNFLFCCIVVCMLCNVFFFPCKNQKCNNADDYRQQRTSCSCESHRK